MNRPYPWIILKSQERSCYDIAYFVTKRVQICAHICTLVWMMPNSMSAIFALISCKTVDLNEKWLAKCLAWFTIWINLTLQIIKCSTIFAWYKWNNYCCSLKCANYNSHRVPKKEGIRIYTVAYKRVVGCFINALAEDIRWSVGVFNPAQHLMGHTLADQRISSSSVQLRQRCGALADSLKWIRIVCPKNGHLDYCMDLA